MFRGEFCAVWIAFGYVIIDIVVCILVITHPMLYQRLMILEAPATGWHPALIWPIARIGEHMRLFVLE